MRAVFGFPMRSGMVRLGALNLYRDWPGPLTDGQHADALVLADLAARWVLETQAGAPPDAVAHELEASADFHFVVRDPAGIVSVQQGISVTEALIRLRAYAFSNDRLLADVAGRRGPQVPPAMNPVPRGPMRRRQLLELVIRRPGPAGCDGPPGLRRVG